MNTLLLLAILVLVIILLSKSASKSQLYTLQRNIDHLNEIISDLTKKIKALQNEKPVAKPTEVKPEEVVTKPAIKETPAPEQQPLPQVIIQKQIIKEETIVTIVPGIINEKNEPPFNAPIPQIHESWYEKWLRNNPDIEKFIGENLINKIGIVVLILGIGFFLKYAIDKDWINEVGRICIGLFCGLVLTGLSFRLRNNYRSFSSVLVGGGLTVFYFTIAFAFHQYSLLSQSAAFIIMVVITAFAVALAILYNRIELGIIATIGGFITPFLVSKGDGNYIVLFIYLAILNTGLIVLAFYKRWHAIHFIAFVFTAIIYGGWIGTNNAKNDFPYAGTFLFGSLFYVMFLIMTIMLYLKKSVKLAALDVGLLITINLGYYSAGIYLLQHWQYGEFKGLFTAGLGVINLALALYFFRRKNIDRNFIYLLIGVTLTFISLTAPVQLSGHYITLFWAAEMVVIFWLYQKSFIKLLKFTSALITALLLASLLMDWKNAYLLSPDSLPVIINKAFITTIFCGIAMSIMAMLLRKEVDTFYINPFTNKLIKIFYTVCSITLFFFAGLFEINYQFANHYPSAGLQNIYTEAYITGFYLLMLFVLKVLKLKLNNYVRVVLLSLMFIYYFASIHNNYLTEKLLLANDKLAAHYLAHIVSIIFMAVILIQTILYLKKNSKAFEKQITLFTWLVAFAGIVFLSAEIKELYVWLMYSDVSSAVYADNLYSKAGLSIVWGLSSFILIWLGMKYSFKTLRIIALVLFGITLLKLFLYDIKNIPPGGKILAFILLGVVLLTVSFMYQRLKKLIIDDAAKKD